MKEAQAGQRYQERCAIREKKIRSMAAIWEKEEKKLGK